MSGADLTAIMALEEAAYEFPWSRAIFHDCLNVGYACWVYETAGVVEAYGVMSLGAGEAHILTLVVSEPSRGQGLGKMMLSHLMIVAKQFHVHTVLLEVRPSNHAAISLYQQLGFNEIGLRPNYYPARHGREDALMMAFCFADSLDQFMH
jgi:ribosomal-protein-alanine N-acetyltransferase